jgi:hypothetical protein
MKRTFTKYPSNYVKASTLLLEMTQEDADDARKMLSSMDNDRLLRYFTRYAVKCEGAQITAPDTRTGDLFALAEEELRSRLGLSN